MAKPGAFVSFSCEGEPLWRWVVEDDGSTAAYTTVGDGVLGRLRGAHPPEGVIAHIASLLEIEPDDVAKAAEILRRERAR